jgi:solute carrier family 25 uncoupling protein 8/9
MYSRSNKFIIKFFKKLITFPIDTSKVRLQIQGQTAHSVDENCIKVIKYRGLAQTIQQIYLEEGLRSLWKGIFAGLQRQVLFAGLRIGFYPLIRDSFIGKGDATLMKRIIAGLFTGAIGIIFASPCDVVKVRLQAQGRNQNDVLPKFQGSVDAYKKIFRIEGFKSFYAGLTPNIIRCSLMNSSELASYDQMKNYIARKYSISPNTKKVHILCASVASLIAVIISSPVDVMKTRMMNVKNIYFC